LERKRTTKLNKLKVIVRHFVDNKQRTTFE